MRIGRRYEPLAALLVLGLVGCEPATANFQTPEFPASWRFSADDEPLRGTGGAVVSTDEYASEAGLSILRAGGTAMDAVIATHFALAVVNPEAGNIGGGGFMVVGLEDGTRLALNFRERAPLASTWNMFLDEGGELRENIMVGHLAAAVPGSVMGMWELHKRFGTKPWAELLAPAIELADGFVMHERLARSLQSSETRLREFDSTAEVFLPGGRAPQVSETFRQPDLAATLRRIAAEGADGFYRGRTADLLIEEMQRGGGIFTHADLEQYTAEWQEPVAVDYRGYKIITMSPPSSGGAAVGQIANILSGYDMRVLDRFSAEWVHLYAEAAKRAFVDRNTYLGDPAQIDVPLAEMTSPEYAARRRATIDTERATPATDVEPGLGPALEGPALGAAEGPNTTHYSIADSFGNMVAVTTTIRNSYGNLLTVKGAGFLLNNQMDDLAARPGFPNEQGLVMGWANSVAPGRRPLSSQTPTLVEDPSGRMFFATGSPGGATIINSSLQSVLNVIDFGMNVAQSVNAPRIHNQHLPDQIQYEEGGLSPETVAALEAMGHTVTTVRAQGDVQAIMRLPDGTLEAWSDQRLGGKVAIF